MINKNKDIPLKIFAALVESEILLSRKEISDICHIQPQLFDYWITILIENGVVIQDTRKRYTTQQIFKDKKLPTMIIPLIKTISDNILTSINKEKCISANLSLYMKYLAEDIL